MGVEYMQVFMAMLTNHMESVSVSVVVIRDYLATSRLLIVQLHVVFLLVHECVLYLWDSVHSAGRDAHRAVAAVIARSIPRGHMHGIQAWGREK